MNSPEYLIAQIVVAILAVSPITAADLRIQDADADTVAIPARIVVKVDPPIPHIAAKNPGVTPRVMEATITVTAEGPVNQTTADFDAWCAAIDANLQPADYPASAITLAAASFPLGFVLDVSTQGFRWEGATDLRTRSCTLRAIYRP